MSNHYYESPYTSNHCYVSPSCANMKSTIVGSKCLLTPQAPVCMHAGRRRHGRRAWAAAGLPGVAAAAASAAARALPDAASAAGWAPEPGESASGAAPELCVSAAGPPSGNERKGAKSARQNQDHQRREPCGALADAEGGAGRHWKKAKQERTTAGHRMRGCKHRLCTDGAAEAGAGEEIFVAARPWDLALN